MYGSEIKFKINLLSESTEFLIDDFDCGNLYINDYLKSKALFSDDTKTYLIINKTKENFESEYKKVLGFFSLTCSAIKYSPNEGKTINNFPAIELKYFALDIKFQGLQYDSDLDDPFDPFNFSDVMFGEILKKCKYIKNNILGAKYLTLYSVPESVSFYKRQYMEDFNQYMESNNNKEIIDCVPMFMSLNEND
ncbi:MAG: hypothetical protein ACRCZO_02935 [Cetobacterium sp.]|uniref:hypothetical protein n=1 Tax=uncultured Cetobacterium sp. TaxID=527638 RepID=UPI0025DAF88B|nr:hypothetical protein [uncultured Cetobacterium sp.]